jgi:hypothetical protein
MKRKAFRLLGAPCQRSGRIRGVLRRLLQTTPGCFILKNFKVHANTMFRLPMNWKIRTPVSHRCTLKEGAPSSGELYEKLWLLCCPQSLFGLPVRDQLPAILEKHRRRVPISSATWWALCTMACYAAASRGREDDGERSRLSAAKFSACKLHQEGMAESAPDAAAWLSNALTNSGRIPSRATSMRRQSGIVGEPRG